MEPSTNQRRVAVAISGAGRSLANLLAKAEPGAGYEIAAVISSRADCGGVDLARQHGLPLFIGDFSPGKAPATGVELVQWLEPIGVSWIALAGFLKLFPLDPLPPTLRRKVLNIHPALLPRFGGKGLYGDHVHKAVLAAGEKISGASIHWVTKQYDEGRVIAQMTVPVDPADSAKELAARVFAAECELYPSVLRRLVEGTLPLTGGAVYRTSYAAP